jgi:Ca2+-transporting ATPase
MTEPIEKVEATSQVTVNELLDLVDPKSPHLLQKLGGLEGLMQKLGTSKEGLPNDPDTLSKQRELYGDNSLPEAKTTTFLEFVIDALKDKTLIILMIAAAFEVAVGIYEVLISNDWGALADGIAIIVAVIVIVLLASISDYQKQAQFKALSEFGRSLLETKTVRGSKVLNVPSPEIVVGDVIFIQVGDIFTADGVLINGFDIECDESAMTGEPFAIRKDTENDPFLLSGTKVLKGSGQMVVIATGVNSLNGRSLMALELEAAETPLQQKLGRIADFIARFAMFGSVGIVIVLFIIYGIKLGGGPQLETTKIVKECISILIIAVTIVVVAVPEGLPLAVTLSLAQATRKMLRDNNLVRNLSACETMGNATTICSDKTGTLTLNKMTVVRCSLFESQFERNNLPGDLINHLLGLKSSNSALESVIALVAQSLNVNSSAEETTDKDGHATLQGSKTEIAIIEFLQSINFPYGNDRKRTEIIKAVPFSSEAKRMACHVKAHPDNEMSKYLGLPNAPEGWIFVKGAAEIIVGSCNKFLNSAGKVLDMTEERRSAYFKIIESYADDALRTIAGAVRPCYPSSATTDAEGNLLMDDLILVCVFGIEDPLRPEVPAAVKSCQDAGVLIRMVTGDSLPTAIAIARGCGILNPDGLSMEGPDFRKLTEQELDAVLPKLQVLARSSPLDKQILVRNLKRLGETVAVTGGN